MQADLWPAVDGPGRRTRSQVAETGSRRGSGCVAALVRHDQHVLKQRQRLVSASDVIVVVSGRCAEHALDVADLLSASTRRRARTVRERAPPNDNIP